MNNISFSFVKEKRVLFLSVQEKNEKKPRTFRSIVCASRELLLSAPIQKIQAIYTHSGFCAILCFRFYVFLKKYRVTTRVCTRKLVQSTAEHAERAASAIRQFAPAGADFPAARTSRTANVGLPSKARANNCWEPWVCASQQKIESPRRESRRLFSSFSRR